MKVVVTSVALGHDGTVTGEGTLVEPNDTQLATLKETSAELGVHIDVGNKAIFSNKRSFTATGEREAFARFHANAHHIGTSHLLSNGAGAGPYRGVDALLKGTPEQEDAAFLELVGQLRSDPALRKLMNETTSGLKLGRYTEGDHTVKLKLSFRGELYYEDETRGRGFNDVTKVKTFADTKPELRTKLLQTLTVAQIRAEVEQQILAMYRAKTP